MDKEAKPSASTTRSNEPPGHEVFCTPKNSEFISKIQYRDLSTSNREIRLLRFLPDTGSGFVECELLPPIKLADVHKQYLALSYCAGNPRNTKAILVNGITCNVFANLHHALTTVHHYWKARECADDLLLWVDQICINQFNLTERSHQVGFMRDIYKSAMETFVCLSVTETEGQGMKWSIQLIQDFVQHQEKEHSHELHTDVQAHRKKFSCCHDFCVYFYREILGDGCYEFLYVLTSPWRDRAWVYQEFLVSERVRFFFGKQSMACNEMAPFLLEICDSILTDIFIFESSGRSVNRFVETFQYSWEDFGDSVGRTRHMVMKKEVGAFDTDLKDLLRHSGSSRASDARDKIFSILGLAHPGHGIVPDYSPDNDLTKVLIETTRKIIEFEDSLDVLKYLGYSNPPHHNRKESLPSWVVDWTVKDDPLLNSGGQRGPKKPIHRSFRTEKVGASFMQLTHQEDLKKMTTVLEVWGTLLDDNMQKGHIQPYRDNMSDDSRYMPPYGVIYKGSRGWQIAVYPYEVESEDELWILRGGPDPFLLRKCPGGYRLAQGVHWLRLLHKLTKGGLDFVDVAGHLHASKLNLTRIRIF